MEKISPLSKNKLKHYLKTKDFLFAQEPFDLYYDSEWDMLITDPVPKEPEKYYETKEYKPHSNAVKSIFDIAYNIVRNIGFKKKYKIITSSNPNAKKILDYGCATGEFVKYMREKGFVAKGLEPDDKSRKHAENLLNDKTYKDISEIKDSFDVITLWHVLEHIPNLEEVILKFREILNPNGKLFIAVPNFKSYDAEYYKEFWAAYDVPRHIWHFSPKAIEKLFGKFGFKLIKQYPLIFDAYYVSLLSEKYKTGKKNIFKAISVGAKSNKLAKKTGNYSSLIYEISK